MVWQERRSAVRHAIELPIRYRVLSEQRQGGGTHASATRPQKTKNVSDSGLLFLSIEYFKVGTFLELSLPVKEKVFTIEGCVVHASQDPESKLFCTGIHFPKTDSIFKIKMAEQVYQIAQYQQSLSRLERRAISEEEAAHRWIEEHSSNFAEFYKSSHS